MVTADTVEVMSSVCRVSVSRFSSIGRVLFPCVRVAIPTLCHGTLGKQLTQPDNGREDHLDTEGVLTEVIQ